MAGWVVLISALAGVVGVIVRLALQCVVVIWSLKDGENRHRHAIEVLKVLQKDRPTAIDRLHAAATRKVPQSGDAPCDTDSENHV